MRFNKNETFELNGKQIRILDLLGEGGQGEVYLVNDGIKDYAFKYYFDIGSADDLYIGNKQGLAFALSQKRNTYRCYRK